MESKMSVKTYLKKYLNPKDDSEKKKKKKKVKVQYKSIKIIDDDIDLSKIRPCEEDEEFDILNNTEDAPQIAGIIDESADGANFNNKQRWKVIADNGEGDIAIETVKNYNEDKSKLSVKSDRISSLKKSRKRDKSSDSESDVSPPRKNKSKQSSDDDLSPPRKSKKNMCSETHPRKSKKIVDSDGDFSPPRRKRKKSTSDEDSNSHRKSTNNVNSDGDLSPPRKSRQGKSSYDKRNKMDSKRDHRKKDESYDKRERRSPRRRDSPSRQKNEDSNQHKKSKNIVDSEGDLSPPRKLRHEKPSSHRRNETDFKDDSRRKDFNESYDERSKQSPQRYSSSSHRREHEKSKKLESPPRRKRPSRWEREDSRDKSLKDTRESRSSKMTKTLDGKKAGLQSAKDMQEEMRKFTVKESEMIKKVLNKESQGKTIYRDRATGRKRDLIAEEEEQREKDRKQEEINEKYMQWGKGLKQIEDHAENLKRDLHEMNKPLARYVDDEDMNRTMKDELREEDPMFEYMKKKKGKDEPEKPQYKGSYPTNRFGIRPGYRWDGVDRSNGFEKKWFESKNSKKAVEEEAYKWSTSDM